jgi:hypothetical protein
VKVELVSMPDYDFGDFIGPIHVVNLPDGAARGAIVKQTEIIVQRGSRPPQVMTNISGAAYVSRTISARDAGTAAYLRDIARIVGAKAVARLQAALNEKYVPGSRTATGRYARGIHYRTDMKGSDVSISIWAYQYREAPYLTSLGGGRFKKDPYKIFPRIGRIPPRPGLPVTLKVPKFGYMSVKPKGRRRKEELKFSIGMYKKEKGVWTEVQTPFGGEMDSGAGDKQSNWFFYPEFVQHPGFDIDVPRQVLLEEAATWAEQVRRGATLIWQGKGNLSVTPGHVTRKG